MIVQIKGHGIQHWRQDHRPARGWLPVLCAALLTFVTTAAGCTPSGPLVLSTIPQAGATSLRVNEVIQIRFDRPIDASSLAKAIALSPAPPGGVGYTLSDDLTAVEITPQGALAPDTQYTLSVSNEARDTNGRRLRKPASIGFRTAPPRQVMCSSPVWSPDGGLVAWLEDAADGRSLWVGSPDGNGAQRLAGNLWHGSGATWTPDSLALITTISDDGVQGIRPLLVFISLEAGPVPVPLPLNAALTDPGQVHVTFSPDGIWMAVQSDMYMADAHSDLVRQLGVARADGTDVEFFGNLLVGWGHDSSWLIYVDMPGIGDAHSFDYDVWRYSLATRTRTQGTAAGKVNNLGQVSRDPAGTHFVFANWLARDVETADGWELVRLPGDLWRMSADGTAVVRLTADSGRNGHPTLAPGGQVAFESDRGNGPEAGAGDGDWDIWLLDSATPDARTTNLTRRAGYDGQPSFSPAGDLIAYVSDATGSREVWVIRADGQAGSRVISGIEGSAGR